MAAITPLIPMIGYYRHPTVCNNETVQEVAIRYFQKLANLFLCLANGVVLAINFVARPFQTQPDTPKRTVITITPPQEVRRVPVDPPVPTVHEAFAAPVPVAPIPATLPAALDCKAEGSPFMAAREMLPASAPISAPPSPEVPRRQPTPPFAPKKPPSPNSRSGSESDFVSVTPSTTPRPQEPEVPPAVAARRWWFW